MNSLAQPDLVAPTTKNLGNLGGSFRYTFPANSLTVLDLSTAGGASTSAARSLASSATTSAAQIALQAIRSGDASIRTAKVTTHPAQPSR
jgi:hypothetical protein